MKVLHILSSDRYSGAENVVCQIISIFKNDIEMVYCSPNGDIANTLKEKGVQFFPLKKMSLKEIKRVVNEFQPDVIHAHDLKAIALVGLLNKKYRKIGHIHVNDKTKMGKTSIKSIVLKYISKRYEHLFWVSKSCLEDYKYKSKLEHKSSVLYNIIDTSRLLALAEEDKENYDYDIVYLGRLTYQKNPIRLINIAEKLKGKFSNFKMAIIGTGDMLDDVKLEIEKANLQDNVFCLGFMRNAYKLLRQSQLMIMTSRFEGTPMVALESLALGVPIVTTKTDGMVDLIQHNENGFLYDSDEQAINYIFKILNDENLRKEMNKNCVNFSNKYNNVEDYKNKLKAVYKN